MVIQVTQPQQVYCGTEATESILWAWLTDAGCSLDSDGKENSASCPTLKKSHQYYVLTPYMATINQQEAAGSSNDLLGKLHKTTMWLISS